MIALVGGIYNIVINAGALHFEHESGQRVTASAHAVFSVGAILGSALTGLLLHFGAGFTGVYMTVSALCLVAVLARDVAAGLAHDPEAGVRPKFDWALLRNRPVILLAVITIVGGVGESVMYVWPAIYLREDLGTAALLGALGSTAFFAAMAVGRFAITPVQNRWGRVPVMIGSGALIAGGMTLALSTRTVAVVIAGFVVVGVAYAAVVPIGYSLAGSVAGKRPAPVAALLGTSISAADLTAPGVVGVLAAALSLRVALGIVVASGVVVALLSVGFGRTDAARALTD